MYSMSMCRVTLNTKHFAHTGHITPLSHLWWQNASVDLRNPLKQWYPKQSLPWKNITQRNIFQMWKTYVLYYNCFLNNSIMVPAYLAILSQWASLYGLLAIYFQILALLAHFVLHISSVVIYCNVQKIKPPFHEGGHKLEQTVLNILFFCMTLCLNTWDSAKHVNWNITCQICLVRRSLVRFKSMSEASRTE